jgi:hypothetical protein
VGRSQESYDRVASEVKEINADVKLTFLPVDCSEIGEVDRVCDEVVKMEEERSRNGKNGEGKPQLNFLVLTVGFMSMKGRNGKSFFFINNMRVYSLQ